ncbi:MAG TPA: potassium channel family protein [Solirubrobacteraceae bacterium]|nr:potassium channel family protein [Solirubrobacteraceae bacterium]
MVLALVVLTVTFIIAAPRGDIAQLISVALAGGVLLAALHAAGSPTRALIVGRTLVALALVVAVVLTVNGGGEPATGLLFLLVSALVLWAPIAITRGVVHQVLDTGVAANSIAGAVAIYLLVGLFFGFLIAGVAYLAPAPYFAQHASATTSEDVYFSFITLSTAGYGDYTPALAVGRALSSLEAVAGQLYLVTVVAVLVSNLRGRRATSVAVQQTGSGAPGSGESVSTDP